MHLFRKILLCFVAMLIVWLVLFFVTTQKTLNVDFATPQTNESSLRLTNSLSDRYDFKRFDKVIERFLKKNELAGANVAIAVNDELKLAKGYGYADIENNIPVEPYNIMRVASMSKLVTAVAIMKLIEEGKLSLNSQVFGKDGILNQKKYLNYIDPRVEMITVRELLNHTGGYVTKWGDPMFMQYTIANTDGFSYPITSEDVIRFMLTKKVHYTPGTSSWYSNYGYAILEKVIEKVGNDSYEDVVKRKVLYPLHIFDMHIGNSYQNQRFENEVKYYEQDESYLVHDHANPDSMVLRSNGGNDVTMLGGAGGWVASASDILKIVCAIDENPKRPDILQKNSIEEMVNIQKPFESPLGWRGIDDKCWYRTGTLSGTSALAVRYFNGLSFVVIFNSSSWKGPTFSHEVRAMMEDAISSVDKWPDYDLYDISQKPTIKNN